MLDFGHDFEVIRNFVYVCKCLFRFYVRNILNSRPT